MLKVYMTKDYPAVGVSLDRRPLKKMVGHCLPTYISYVMKVSDNYVI